MTTELWMMHSKDPSVVIYCSSLFSLSRKTKQKQKQTHNSYFPKARDSQRGSSTHRDSGVLTAITSMVLGLLFKPCGRTSGRRSLGLPHTVARRRCWQPADC